MECTCLFNDLLANEEQSLPPTNLSEPSNIIFSSQLDHSLRRGAVFDTHAQAKKASNLITKLEARCSGVRTGRQLDGAVTEQINLSYLKDDPQDYYSGVSALLDQRLQAAIAKYRARVTKRPKSTMPPMARMTLADLSDPSSSAKVPQTHPDQLMMEKVLYPSLTILDHSQQANAQSVSQTLHEVQQLYKHIAATVQHDGDRILGLHETIDTTVGIMDKANGFVQKTYVLSRRYHSCIVLVLLIILAWIIIRGAVRRI